MKIGLLGTGKTGQKVADRHPDTISFNSANPPSADKLKDCDVVISFLPGDAFKEYIPLLIESKKFVITGSTGFEWEKSVVNKINNEKITWVKAHNFSLGMNLVKAMIETLSKATSLYPDADFFIHDIHHTKKLDAPSGTALSWEHWLGKKAEISSERIGDVIGYHHLEMKSHLEHIKITHEAQDRGMFAAGALWAAKKIFENKQWQNCGLIDFSTLVNKSLNI